MNADKKHLREYYRKQRQSLSAEDRTAFAQTIFDSLIKMPLIQKAQHIAFYRALREEISTDLLLDWALSHHQSCYVPIVSDNANLQFVAVSKETIWKPNKFSVLEPADPHSLTTREPAALDVILVPLVSFDKKGTRLGMGAGFYDKTFAFKKEARTPTLIGLAFECQQHDQLPCASWDIPLDMVVTEKSTYYF